mmetsp:Transcript_30688/g.58213  ORF Transcript_30688/g.58213 Transcript_30688/m.58213 type:complete len:189 (+) Transcript_30688:397-963(+)
MVRLKGSQWILYKRSMLATAIEFSILNTLRVMLLTKHASFKIYFHPNHVHPREPPSYSIGEANRSGRANSNPCCPKPTPSSVHPVVPSSAENPSRPRTFVGTLPRKICRPTSMFSRRVEPSRCDDISTFEQMVRGDGNYSPGVRVPRSRKSIQLAKGADDGRIRKWRCAARGGETNGRFGHGGGLGSD